MLAANCQLVAGNWHPGLVMLLAIGSGRVWCGVMWCGEWSPAGPAAPDNPGEKLKRAKGNDFITRHVQMHWK